MPRPTRFAPVFAFLAACFASSFARARAGDPTLLSGQTAPAPSAKGDGVEEADLERMLAPLFSDEREARFGAARQIENIGQDALGAMAKKLADLRKASSPPVTAAIKAASRSRYQTANDDLGDALIGMGTQTKSEGGYRTALTTVILLKALARVGTTPAIRQLIRAAIDHGGALRPEVNRHVKALGDRAVPALIETRSESSAELRHWAYSQLEAMGKRVPGDAVQTRDNQVLADVLRAFANAHEMDALPVLLSFVNSDRLQVRAAAREALGQFGPDAVWKLREAYSNVTGKPAPESWQATRVARELFSTYDRLRLQETYGLLEEGLAREKEGRLNEAIAAFDKVLARHPTLDRRAEMVGAYVEYAKALEDTEPARSNALLRKATRIWPETSRATQIEAEIAYLEGKDLLARGIPDVGPLQRAVALDPNHEKARAELSHLEATVEAHEAKVRVLAGLATVTAVVLTGTLLFGRRRRA